MVNASLSFRVRAEKRTEVLGAANALLIHARHQTGCGRSSVLTDVEDPNMLSLTTDWIDVDAAEAFFHSPDFDAFRSVVIRDEPALVLDETQSLVTKIVRTR
jgi:quinol monooxygenase YgiN